MKGKLIVIYGTNNLGKTTQAKLLVEKLKEQGFDTTYLKYPIYNLEPTGPRLNKVLRSGKPQEISEVELQELYAQNRRDFQPTLQKMLDQGKMIVAEDYTGTGIAWGLTKGVELTKLESQNEDLIKEDIAILLDGEPFADGQEENHLHETNEEFMKKCRENHLFLAKRYNWKIINANQLIEEVSKQIWQEVQDVL